MLLVAYAPVRRAVSPMLQATAPCPAGQCLLNSLAVLPIRSRAFRIATLFVALLAPYAPGCSDDHDEAAGRPGVVYEGGTNDEALDKLLSATPKSDPAKRPELVLPTRGAHVPAAPIPTFSWKPSATGFYMPQRVRTKFAASFPFGPIREAKAHGSPVNGKAYLVTFAAPGQPTLVQVFTTKTTYQPDETTWTNMKNVRGDISITVTVGTFDNNNLVQDGGPFASDAVPFTVGQQ